MKYKVFCLGKSNENFRYNHKATEETEFLGFAKENKKVIIFTDTMEF